MSSSTTPSEDRLAYLHRSLNHSIKPPIPPPSPPPAPPQVNIWRQIPLRYLGYVNELGETVKPHLTPRTRFLYPASYAVSSLYVLQDSRVHASTTTKEGQSWVLRFVDGLLWQSFASVLIPGFAINRVVSLTSTALKANPRGKVIASGVGLVSIPVIVGPIDRGVEWGMDKTVRRILGTQE